MIDYLENLIGKLEWHILKTVRWHDNYALAILRSMKGLGKILSLTVLYEILTIKRFKTVQCFSSYE